MGDGSGRAGGQNRTGDILLTGQALYRLSYTGVLGTKGSNLEPFGSEPNALPVELVPNEAEAEGVEPSSADSKSDALPLCYASKRVEGIEPTCQAWKARAQPMSDTRVKRPPGLEPGLTAWEAAVLPLHHGRVPPEGLEPS